MFRNAKWQMVCCAAMISFCITAAQADYEAGQAAWNAGQHKEAVTKWWAAAAQDDSRAMLALGRAFTKGLGVPQDYVEAHKWLNLAAGRGDVQAAAERDVLAEKITAEERVEARKLARAWPSRVERRSGAAADITAGPPPKQALREAQALLAALGYKPGPADGAWGQGSIKAYRAFLHD